MSRKYRCAVYTRKSTEEGLDQEFNSLDAQRESCEAYIKSQRHEGWKLLPDKYDDGGISGGTMKRPALQRLLNEVRAGRVDIIVVYKVDRLTRALSDFARMVELFDEHDASFVSVTQQFNTTTSMGRLTLNVLLSFAQFEREVAGERIRDKIAASKKRGMWMGGPVPLGYDSVDKKLVVNETEAKTVQTLFGLYLLLGNVRQVKQEADRRSIRSKIRALGDGIQTGGKSLSRGQLYCLLKNRIFVGEVTHKGQSYDGAHDAIIDRDTWDAVQARLKQNAGNRRSATNAKSPSPLAGLLWGEDGERLIPSHACKSGKRYRYYVSANDRDGFSQAGWRLPAKEIERVVTHGLISFLSDRARLAGCAPNNLLPAKLESLFAQSSDVAQRLKSGSAGEKKALLQGLVQRIDVGAEQLSLIVEADWLSSPTTIDIPLSFRRSAQGEKIIIAAGDALASNPDPKLIRAVALGYSWHKELKRESVASLGELAERHGVLRRDAGRIFRLGLLAPDIIEAILEGRQPPDITFRHMKRLSNIPVSWAEQREFLGFPG